jgi:hypothetical protein
MEVGNEQVKITPGKQWLALRAWPRFWGKPRSRVCAVCKYGGHAQHKCFLTGELLG